MNKFLTTLTVLLVFVSTTVSAGNYYVAAQANHSNNSISGLDVDNSTGIGVGMGYNITDIFAIEATYEDFGKGDLNSLRYGSDSTTVWAVLDNVVGHVDLGTMQPVRIIVRAGYAHTDFNASYDNGYMTRATFKTDDNRLAYGIGFSVGINKRTEFTIDYRVRDINDATSGLELDFKTASMGLKFEF